MSLRSKVIIAKRKQKDKLSQRKDHQNILCIDDEDVENQRAILENNMDGSEDEFQDFEDVQGSFEIFNEKINHI